MQLKDIAIKNLQRRKTKMLFLVFGMVFSIATIVALFTLTSAMEESVNRKVEETGIKLAIVPKTDTISFSVGGIPIVSGVSFNQKLLPADSLETIKSIPDYKQIKIISPKYMGTTQVEGQKALLVGVQFQDELKIKSWWEYEGKIPEGADQALIGYKVADKTGASIGDVIDVGGQKITVSAILKETGEEEDGILFVPQETAKRILANPQGYSFIELTTVKDDVIAGNLSRQIAQVLPDAKVNVVKEAAESRQELVDRFSRFSLVVSLVMILIALLIITSTMMASVNERTREIGIFRAIGFRKVHIVKIILLEAGIICGISALVGYFLGMGASMAIAPLFGSFQIAVSWNLLLFAMILLGAVAMGLLASLYPASRASKLDPADSLRFM